MLDSFTDTDGQKYPYHSKFKAKGDIVIISSDKIAFSMDSKPLERHSSVFQQMFETCDQDLKVITVDHPSSILKVYLECFTNPSGPRDLILSDHLEALELCVRYDSPEVARRVANRFLLPEPEKVGPNASSASYSREDDLAASERARKLIVFASKFNDVFTAARVLTACGPQHYGYDFWDVHEARRSKESMADLPSAWVWAYLEALKAANEAELENYWAEVAGHFIWNLE